jgi:hypothetical protein
MSYFGPICVKGGDTGAAANYLCEIGQGGSRTGRDQLSDTEDHARRTGNPGNIG